MSCNSNRAPGGTQTAVGRVLETISFRFRHWEVNPRVPLENVSALELAIKPDLSYERLQPSWRCGVSRNETTSRREDPTVLRKGHTKSSILTWHPPSIPL